LSSKPNDGGIGPFQPKLANGNEYTPTYITKDTLKSAAMGGTHPSAVVGLSICYSKCISRSAYKCINIISYIDEGRNSEVVTQYSK
jgi:hypothetical protein